jgi:hypothetical protein
MYVFKFRAKIDIINHISNIFKTNNSHKNPKNFQKDYSINLYIFSSQTKTSYDLIFIRLIILYIGIIIRIFTFISKL